MFTNAPLLITGALYNVAMIGEPSFNCGCVLVNEDTIITAAHCVSTNMSVTPQYVTH